MGEYSMRANSRVLDGSVRALSVLLVVQAWVLAAQPVAAQIHAGANTKGAESKNSEIKNAQTNGVESKGAEIKNAERKNSERKKAQTNIIESKDAEAKNSERNNVETKGAEPNNSTGKEAVSPDSTPVKSAAKDMVAKDKAAKDKAAQDATAMPTKPVKPVSFDEYKKTVRAIDYRKYEVSLPELEKLIGKKGVYVLDLRSEREYNEGHIKGALHMGSDISEEKVSRLLPDKDATAIIYCTNNFYPSRMLSLNHGCLPQFVTLGYKNVKVLQELWQGGFDKARDFMKGPLWVKEDDKTTAK
jgi:hypothetical protein